MVVNFGAADNRDHPTLILRNLDGTAIQTLGYAFNVEAELYYNETSSISFDLPAYADGQPVPHYNDVVGMRIVDLRDWGQFILVNPEVRNDGIRETKRCKAYSLEYEFTFKKIFIEEGTYNFYNTVAPAETIIGIILEYMPSWSVGSIDKRLYGKYRTFEVTNDNVYNFIKSTVQESYGCVFDFDTYNRTINVVSTESLVATKPVSVSLDNLAKEISVSEDTENIFTCLDVNGADGVDIRSVNPTGTNKIYNLNYYMTLTNFSQEMIDKYHAWEQKCDAVRKDYNDLTVELSILDMSIATEEYFIAKINKATIVGLEAARNVYIEFLGVNGYDNPDSDYNFQQLQALNGQITDTRGELAARESRLEALKAEKVTVLQQMIAINQRTSWDAFFTPAEIEILNRYVKEDAIEDSTFVAETVHDYTSTDKGETGQNMQILFSGGTITKSTLNGRDIYNIRGGALTADGSPISGAVISAAAEEVNGRMVVTAYMSANSVFDITAQKACVTVSGTATDVIDQVEDETIKWLKIIMVGADAYYTQETTEFSKYSVEWDLYEHGKECLDKLAYPSYTFNVSSANFLALEDFDRFRRALSLGQKIYLSMAHVTAQNNIVLQPILVGVKLSFEDPSRLDLQFGSTYSLNDPSFSLVDLIEKSVTMGKTLDTGRFNYNSFVSSGANTEVRDFIDSALDVAQNQILSNGDMAISWSEAGLYLRKWENEQHNDYMPEQVAMINNMIAFTDDNWETVKMAIGEFKDKNFQDSVWGIVAPNIVGTLLAGENLVIESQKQDGGVAVFKVDGNGALLHNAKFELVDQNHYGHILLDPDHGFGIGMYPVINPQTGEFDYDPTTDTGNAKFWVDMNGNLHFRGTLNGADGKFSGALEAATGTFNGALNIGPIAGSDPQDYNFKVDSNGNVTAKSGTFSGDITGSTGTFTGSINVGDNTFVVDSNGNVTANSITAATLTGVLNGQDGSWLVGSGIKVGENPLLQQGYNFYVDQNGNCSLNGNIYMNGNIVWGSGNAPVEVQYSANGLTDWHSAYNALTDYWARYKYNGESTWGAPIKIRGQDGQPGSDANVNFDNVLSALTNNYTDRGLYYYQDLLGEKHLLINADYIRTGTINAGTVQIRGSYEDLYGNQLYAGLATAYGQQEQNVTYGCMVYGSLSPNFNPASDTYGAAVATNAGARISYYLWGNMAQYVAVSQNGCYSSSSIITGSDRRIKHNIDYDMSSYETFFMNLQPCHFIYNNDFSGFVDIGFIAQEVEDAIISSGMDTKDFAGLQIYDDIQYNDLHGLRYNSFIALNTHMIQKLYKRVEALEAQLGNIKEITE